MQRRSRTRDKQLDQHEEKVDKARASDGFWSGEIATRVLVHVTYEQVRVTVKDHPGNFHRNRTVLDADPKELAFRSALNKYYIVPLCVLDRGSVRVEENPFGGEQVIVTFRVILCHQDLLDVVAEELQRVEGFGVDTKQIQLINYDEMRVVIPPQRLRPPPGVHFDDSWQPTKDLRADFVSSVLCDTKQLAQNVHKILTQTPHLLRLELQCKRVNTETASIRLAVTKQHLVDSALDARLFDPHFPPQNPNAACYVSVEESNTIKAATRESVCCQLVQEGEFDPHGGLPAHVTAMVDRCMDKVFTDDRRTLPMDAVLATVQGSIFFVDEDLAPDVHLETREQSGRKRGRALSSSHSERDRRVDDNESRDRRLSDVSSQDRHASEERSWDHDFSAGSARDKRVSDQSARDRHVGDRESHDKHSSRHAQGSSRSDAHASGYSRENSGSQSKSSRDRFSGKVSASYGLFSGSAEASGDVERNSASSHHSARSGHESGRSARSQHSSGAHSDDRRRRNYSVVDTGHRNMSEQDTGSSHTSERDHGRHKRSERAQARRNLSERDSGRRSMSERDGGHADAFEERDDEDRQDDAQWRGRIVRAKSKHLVRLNRFHLRSGMALESTVVKKQRVQQFETFHIHAPPAGGETTTGSRGRKDPPPLPPESRPTTGPDEAGQFGMLMGTRHQAVQAERQRKEAALARAQREIRAEQGGTTIFVTAGDGPTSQPSQAFIVRRELLEKWPGTAFAALFLDGNGDSRALRREFGVTVGDDGVHHLPRQDPAVFQQMIQVARARALPPGLDPLPQLFDALERFGLMQDEPAKKKRVVESAAGASSLYGRFNWAGMPRQSPAAVAPHKRRRGGSDRNW